MSAKPIAVIAVIVVFGGFSAAVRGRVITVDDDGPADFNNISAAIADADSGDEVRVSSGIYCEQVFMKDGVNVAGAGADVTTIDGCGIGHVVEFNTVTAEISGFTITGGS